MRVLIDKKGNVMPYVVFLISLIIMPLMIMTMELTRAMYVDIHLQAATDAACSAASQAANVPYFIQTGELTIDISAGRTYAYREFDATISDHSLRKYFPVLTSVNLVSDTIVACESTAQMQWMLPGIPSLTLNSSALAETQARR